MPDNNPTPDYQDILDKYAASLNSTDKPLIPEPESETQTEPQLETKPELEPIISKPPEVQTPLESPLQPEAIISPVPPIELAPESAEIIPPAPLDSPKPTTEAVTPLVSPEPNNEGRFAPPIELPFETPPVLPQKENHFFKYLFFFSLIIFILILISVFLSFVKSQQSLSGTQDTPAIIISPTAIPIPVCEINDQKYVVGESFSATDGCNTCSCTTDLTIVCTEMACEATPSVKLTPTKTATISATITPIEILAP